MLRNFTLLTLGICACVAGGLGGCGKEAPPSTPTASNSPRQPSTEPKPHFPGEAAPPAVQMGPSTSSKPTDVRPTPSNSTTAPSTAPVVQPPITASTTKPTASIPDPTSKVATFAGLTGPKPATWIWGPPPQGGISIAEYTVPGVEGADQAKVTVFTLPGGGTLDANISRWKMQFRDEAGAVGSIEPTVETLEVSGMPVSVVQFQGDYRGMGMANYAPNQIFLVAVVERPEDKVFIRLVGPPATVQPNREAFMQLVKGLEPVEPEK